jgi:hypothetical protein
MGLNGQEEPFAIFARMTEIRPEAALRRRALPTRSPGILPGLETVLLFDGDP